MSKYVPLRFWKSDKKLKKDGGGYEFVYAHFFSRRLRYWGSRELLTVHVFQRAKPKYNINQSKSTCNRNLLHIFNNLREPEYLNLSWAKVRA